MNRFRDYDSLSKKQPSAYLIHPIMFSSRRKSCPDASITAQGTVTKPANNKKRRGSNGFLNPEYMSSGGDSMGGFTGEWVQRGGWRPTGPPVNEGSRNPLADLRHPGLDAIRFASYRTAAKLRYVQKRTNMNLIDIWNIIEAFRENGLNTLDPHTSVKVSRLETLISTLYHSLNKRLPSEQHINIQASTSTLLNWLLASYDRDFMGQLRVFSVKVALATLCNSKPLDKLRYIFSQISDSNGHLSLDRFSEYLHEVLSLPAAVYESPSFHYTPDLVNQIFDGVSKINVNDFLDVVLAEPGPECLSWLPLLHRLAASETVVHQTMCDGCRRESITGLRYKCDQCYNYNLCQDCFWLGRISTPHSLNHSVKEYLAYNPSRPLGASVRRNLRCVPDRPPADRPRFPETPERTLDLAHIVPPSTQGVSNGVDEEANGLLGSCDTWSSGRSLSLSGLPDWGQLDEEHRLIAHYASCLAGQTTSPGCESMDSNQSFDPHKTKRTLIVALEKKNKEITKQINKIREQQEKCEGGRVNPTLVSELKALRSHRTQLESHLISLQDSRKSLLGQLEGLMKLLKTSNQLHQPSPPKLSTSSTTTSFFSATTDSTTTSQSLKSPPNSTTATIGSVNSLPSATKGSSGPRSAPPTPSHTNHYSSLDSINSEHLGSSGLSSLRSSCFGSLGHQGSLVHNTSSLGYNTGSLGHNTGSLGHNTGSLGHNTGSLGHSTGSFGQGSLGHQRLQKEDPEGTDLSPDSEGEKLRNDLLLAADSVTNAMSSLVRELNSESSEEESHQQKRRSLRDSDPNLLKWGSQGIRLETNGPKREVPNVQRRSQRSASCGGVRMPPARDSWSEPPAGLLKR